MRTIYEPDEHHGGVYELESGEGAVLFDEACRNKLGLSGPEFLAAYDAGSLPDTPEVFQLSMLIPFAR